MSYIKYLTENYFYIGFVRFLDKITNEKKRISFLTRGKQRLSNELQRESVNLHVYWSGALMALFSFRF